MRSAIALRIGPDVEVDGVLGHLNRLHPEREPGRLTFAVGADRVRDVRPPLVEKTRAEGAPLTGREALDLAFGLADLYREADR